MTQITVWSPGKVYHSGISIASLRGVHIPIDDFVQRYLRGGAPAVAFSPLIYEGGERKSTKALFPPKGSLILSVLDFEKGSSEDSALGELSQTLKGIVVPSKSGGRHLYFPLRVDGDLKGTYSTLKLLATRLGADPVVYDLARIFFLAPQRAPIYDYWDPESALQVQDLVKIFSLGSEPKRSPRRKVEPKSPRFKKVQDARWEYLLEVFLPAMKKVPGYHFHVGEHYIAFDADPGYKSPLSFAYYLGHKGVYLWSLDPIQRLSDLYGPELIPLLGLKQNESGRWLVMNFPLLLQKVAQSHGVRIWPYEFWVKARLFLKSNVLQKYYEAFISEKPFSPKDKGWKLLAENIHNYPEFRELIQQLKFQAGLQSVRGRKGGYRFPRGGLRKVSLLFSAFNEALRRLGIPDPFRILSSALQGLSKVQFLLWYRSLSLKSSQISESLSFQERPEIRYGKIPLTLDLKHFPIGPPLLPSLWSEL